MFYGEVGFDWEDFTPTPALPPQGGGGIKVASSRGRGIGYARKGTDHMKIAAVERYRRLCQKNESENYLLDKYIFRKISIYFTIVAIKLGLTANQATFLSLLAALGSLYFLMLNTARDLLAAAVLIFLYYILDHVDGELARYHIATGRQTPSLQGHYFDLLVHRYSSNLMLFFMAISVYRLFGYEYAVLLGFVACIGVSSFPNVVAAHVLAGRLAHDPGSSKARRRSGSCSSWSGSRSRSKRSGAGRRPGGRRSWASCSFSPDILLRSSLCSSPILLYRRALCSSRTP